MFQVGRALKSNALHLQIFWSLVYTNGESRRKQIETEAILLEVLETGVEFLP
jgi:hypothetical protein